MVGKFRNVVKYFHPKIIFLDATYLDRTIQELQAARRVLLDDESPRGKAGIWQRNLSKLSFLKYSRVFKPRRFSQLGKVLTILKKENYYNPIS